VAITSIDQTVEPVAKQTSCRKTEQVRAIGGIGQLLQRSVEADRLLGVVLDRCLDDEDADQGENDPPREVPRDSGPSAPFTFRLAHLARAPLVLKLLRQPTVGIPEARADDAETR